MDELQISRLSEKKHLYKETISLIEKSLGYQGTQNSFEKDFQLLLEGNDQHLYILHKDDEVISHIGVVHHHLIYKDLSIPVLLWGGICVKDEYRGRGIFLNFFEKIFAQVSDSAALSMLWSDLDKLYSKLGFYEFGLIQVFQGQKNQNTDFSTMKTLSKNDHEEIKNQYRNLSQDHLIIERDDKYWNLIFNHQSIQVKKFAKGFAFANKGLDLQQVIFEFYKAENYKDMSQGQYQIWDTFNLLRNQLSEDLRYMGFIKIHGTPHFQKAIEKLSHNKLKILAVHEDVIEISFDNSFYKLKQRDFIRGIWGPDLLSEFKDIFPPICISGIDSI